MYILQSTDYENMLERSERHQIHELSANLWYNTNTRHCGQNKLMMNELIEFIMQKLSFQNLYPNDHQTKFSVPVIFRNPSFFEHPYNLWSFEPSW